jgi:aminoglycoside phosphotransferase (APT) family kinase protein
METSAERLPDEALGDPIAQGRDAKIFALGSDRVVRRTGDDRDLTIEAGLMEHVRAAGYPAPRVWRVAPGEMVMERVHGPTLLEELERKPWRVRPYARLLGELHNRVHRITAPSALPAHHIDGSAVLHFDLHPANVIVSADGPVVIDWGNARRGDPAADVADAWLIMACFGREWGPPPKGWRRRATVFVLDRGEGFVRRVLVDTFLSVCDRDAARRVLPAAAERRLRDHNVRPHEAAAVRALVAKECPTP